jgi:hypothetical protein
MKVKRGISGSYQRERIKPFWLKGPPTWLPHREVLGLESSENQRKPDLILGALRW